MSKYPNDAKRLAIIQDYLTSDLSKYAIAKKYQISRAYKELVELAEETYDIEILKNSEAE